MIIIWASFHFPIACINIFIADEKSALVLSLAYCEIMKLSQATCRSWNCTPGGRQSWKLTHIRRSAQNVNIHFDNILWNVFVHSTYRPDITLCDVYLFLHLKRILSTISQWGRGADNHPKLAKIPGLWLQRQGPKILFHGMTCYDSGWFLCREVPEILLYVSK